MCSGLTISRTAGTAIWFRVFDTSGRLGVQHTRIIPEYLLFRIFLLQTKLFFVYPYYMQTEIQSTTNPNEGTNYRISNCVDRLTHTES